MNRKFKGQVDISVEHDHGYKFIYIIKIILKGSTAVIRIENEKHIISEYYMRNCFSSNSPNPSFSQYKIH